MRVHFADIKHQHAKHEYLAANIGVDRTFLKTIRKFSVLALPIAFRFFLRGYRCW